MTKKKITPARIPLIKPYLKKNENNVMRWRRKQITPLEISRHHLKRVIHKITDGSKQKVRLAKRSKSEETTLSLCVHPSMDVLTFKPSSILAHNTNALLHQIRKSLLSHDWNSSSQLLQLLISSKLINTRMLIYIIRCSLLLFLNHCNHSEILEDYLTVTLGMNDETKMNQFISSIFSFPKDIKPKRRRV